ncbi:MAG: hypothetical protein Kow0013_22540 [Pararhodobacter sp.]
MHHDFSRLIDFALAMIAIAAVILSGVALWRGRTWVRAGHWRALTWGFVLLSGLNGWAFVVAMLEGARLADTPAAWIIAALFGPAQAGLALGAALGLLRPSPDSDAG